MNRIILLTATLLCCSLLAGCNLREDESDCAREMSITFSFTKDGQERFGTDVSSVSLFVFDEKGTLVARRDEWDQSKLVNDYVMNITLAPGQYHCVAWGGISTDHYHMCRSGESQGNASPPAVGSSVIGDMLVRLNTTDYTIFGQSRKCVSTIPASQFFGRVDDITIARERTTRVNIDLTKNSNKIELTLKGLPANTRGAADNYEFGFQAPNIGYDFNNETEVASGSTTYLAHNINEPVAEQLEMDIHTLRMIFGKEHKFVIWDCKTASAYFEADLLEDYIRKAPAYSTQAAVDAEDLFRIEIDLHSNVAVNVTVNGWEVVGKQEEIQ